MSTEKATQVLASWESFCDGIKASGRRVLESARDNEELTHAEGLRYLTRLLRSGIERFVEYWDPLDPCLAVTYNDRLKWGLDNPDSIYSISAVDGRYEYELTGNIGTVSYFNLTSAEMGTNARQTTTGFLDGADVTSDEAGDFTIRIGGPERVANWLRLAPGSNTVMLRQTFGDRTIEREMSARISIVSDVGPDRPLAVAQIIDRVKMAEAFVGNTGVTFVKLADLMRKNVNGLPEVDEALMKAMGGDPNYFYYWSAFEILESQALLVHLCEIPECENWGLCLYDHWLESLDYTRAAINVNKFTAAYNPDGSVTIVIAHERPQEGHWLSTRGHVSGNMMFRWTKAKTKVAPRTALVQADTIDWATVLQRWKD